MMRPFHAIPRAILPLLVGVCSLSAADTTPEMAEALQRFRALDELTRLVQREYVHPVSRGELWSGAMAGMLAGLDRSSRYLDRAALAAWQSEAEADRFGFDWRFDPERQAVVITRVVSNSPAAAAGMLRGDQLLSADEEDLDRLGTTAIGQVLAGLGDRAKLALRRADGQLRKVEVERSVLTDSGLARIAMLDRDWGLGLIVIDRFREDMPVGGAPPIDDGHARSFTGRAFRTAVAQLEQDGLRALIIDLRGNGGGSLSAAIEVADCFLDPRGDDGTLIVAVDSRNPAHQARHLARAPSTLGRYPLVVLIDGDSASSAEIVAAALRDHQRAILVGSPSRGKASVQQLFLLGDGSAVSLTVAHYRTPAGQDLGRAGLRPDVLVEQSAEDLLRIARDGDVADEALRRAGELAVAMLIQSGLSAR